MTDETDDTVRLNGPRVGERTGFARTLPYAAATIVLAAVAGAGAWWSLRPEAVPPAQQLAMAPSAVPALPQAPPVPAVSQAPAPPTPPAVPLPPLATEAQILADAPEQTTIYRFAPQPAVIVVQFPNLREQATMLNRVAALIEKDGFPRDRVLDHAELDTRIRAAGVTPDTFYYGHDYRSADITRFFAIATGLNGDEGRLRNLIAQLGWREHGALGALISLVRENSTHRTRRARPRHHPASRTLARRLFHRAGIRSILLSLLARRADARRADVVHGFSAEGRLRSHARGPDRQRDPGLPGPHARPAILRGLSMSA